jgi:transcriptional regulator with XRE-family HTH domain
MGRLMLNMSLTVLGEAIGVSCEQLHKYETGTNRIGASRLQQISRVLQVPVTFFFERVPQFSAAPDSWDPLSTPDPWTELMITREGLALVRAFTQIKSPQLRRSIVNLVQQIEENQN